jgi:hypothetical protein
MKLTYIKLFIGLVLFATLVALTVLQVPNAGRLVDLLYVALVGLGITHLATPGSEGIGVAAPANKEGGHALPGFLAALCLGSLALSGCVTAPAGPALTPLQSTQVHYTQACAAWDAGFSTALELRRAGKLSPYQINQITILDSQATPLCTGPLPTDPAAAAQQVTAAVTTLAIVEELTHNMEPK